MKRKRPTNQKRFSDRMVDILNMGALSLAMAIGYRTRLFDVMDSFESPQRAASIAERAALKERYVREWLGIMVSGDIVEWSEDSTGEDLFFLPKDHGNILTRRAGNSNLGVYTQEIPLLTTLAMEPVIRGFSTGEGIGYDRYTEFYAFMAQLSRAKHRDILVEKFLPSVAGGRIIRQMRSGIRVCDLGCAEGIAVMLMAEAFPQSQFFGIDFSDEAIAYARREAAQKKLPNVVFERLDAALLGKREDLLESFDYVTAFDAIHDQARPLDALAGVHAVLKEDGLFSMVDISAGSRLSENKDHPMGPFLYTVSLMHCMPVGLVGGGAGLGMMWGREKAVEMLKQAGFGNVQVLDIPEDPFNQHFLCKKNKNLKYFCY